MIEDRRQFQRVIVDSPVSIFLDKRVCGPVLDLSEQGLAVSGAASWSQGDVLPFAFELPEEGGQIYGRAKIVWKDESAYRMGFHLLDLADRSREQLMQWVSARVYTMSPSGSEQESQQPMVATQVALPLADPDFQDRSDVREIDFEASAPVPHVPGEEFEPANLESTVPESLNRYDSPNRYDSSNRTIRLAFATLLLLLICGFGVHVWRGTRNSAQAAASAAETKTDAIAAAKTDTNEVAKTDAPAPAIPAEPAPSPSAPPAISSQAARLDLPGFILQVGAMTEQRNADALAENLQKNKFPAFVYQRGSDRFYRVAVGPFRDEKSPVKTKADLEKRGLKPFLRTWTPE